MCYGCTSLTEPYTHVISGGALIPLSVPNIFITLYTGVESMRFNTLKAVGFSAVESEAPQLLHRL